MSQHHKTTRARDAALESYRAQCAAVDAPCWMDGRPIDYAATHDDHSNDDRFQRDHYYPASTHPHLYDDPANWRPSHAGCNRVRGNGPPPAGLGITSRDWNDL